VAISKSTRKVRDKLEVRSALRPNKNLQMDAPVGAPLNTYRYVYSFAIENGGVV